MNNTVELNTKTSRFLEKVLFVVSALSLGAILWTSWQQTQLEKQSTEKLLEALPALQRENDYVSSNQCQSCHPDQHASWHKTYHRTMTQVARPENVAGNFDGSTIWSDGLPYEVYRKGDEFRAKMPDPDEMMFAVQGGKPIAQADIPRVDRQVVMTTGSHHYQTYWVESPRYDRLLQTLPLVYLIQDERWIPREAAFMRAPNETKRFITQWNHHCIRCHSTGDSPGLNAETGMLESKVGELGISCEACHGPGEEHIRHHQNPLNRYRQHFASTPDSTIVNPANLDHRLSSQTCGQCHGVYIQRKEYGMKYAYEGVQYRPGEDLHKTRYYIQHPTTDPSLSAERLEELKTNPDFFRERWWDDGTILAGGREFTAMSVTACYTKGEISCLSCHTMHGNEPADQLIEGLQQNQSCTQCHKDAEYNESLESHTFHAAESSGSQCLNCHMPYTSYALFGAIRSHQIDSPKVESSARYGVPNACNLCHLDKTLAWTQNHLANRYGRARTTLSREQNTLSAALLWILKGHAAQRAVVSWHFGWGPAREASGEEWMAPFLARLLTDPYGVVRYIAEHQLKSLRGFEEFDYDFLGTTDSWKKAVERAIADWRNTRVNKSAMSNPAVLIDSKGDVMEHIVQRLLKQRDNRPVTIKE